MQTSVGTAYSFEALMKPSEAVLRLAWGPKTKTLVGYLHDLRPPGLWALQ